MEIFIPNGKICLVDEEDFLLLSKFKWREHSHGYVVRSQWIAGEGKSRSISMHREIMNPPMGYEIDHINGNKLDNRKSNLRICLHHENKRNSKKRTRNKFKGVYQDKKNSKSFWASICIYGQTINLGSYESEGDAAIAYDAAAKEMFGEFARLNLP